MQSKKSQRVKCIEYNVVIYYSDDEISKKHTIESKKLLSAARRSRTVQPNQGKSKKASNFYQQLHKDYSLSKKNDDLEWQSILKETVSKDDEKKIKEWLKNNKSKFALSAEETKNIGIITDYSDQYDSFAEIRIEEVLYDNNDDSNNGAFEKNIDEVIMFKAFTENLNEQLKEFYNKHYDTLFLQYFKEIELFKFDIMNSYDIEYEDAEKQLNSSIANKKTIENIDKDAYNYLLQLAEKVKYINKAKREKER